ncbi:MAG: hypothetical protein ACFCD0_03425 [Gemmataceae bacterium]
MRNQWKSTLGILAVACAVSLATGCQTYEPRTGLTLPTPRYLDHFPQAIPQTPPFPLANEVESLKAAQERERARARLPIGGGFAPGGGFGPGGVPGPGGGFGPAPGIPPLN